ncbi:glycosyltransferase [Herbiconiux sp. YIM B11900]|uniref:glycosyltransferase n=1 Tax=Herbiconiux sp. YIM B11900 TaxID=3404131 RepID=UPI003F8445B1
MSLRIALVTLHTSPLEQPGQADAGGMNVYLVGVADALAARGHEVELLTRATDAAAGATGIGTTPGGVPVRFLRAGPLAPIPKASLPALIPEFTRALVTLPRFDVVHSHYWLSGLAGLEAAAAWNAPHVLSLHTVAALKNERLAPGDRPEPAERLDAERMLVRASALTVAATSAERAAILRATGVDPDRVVGVPPGVDTALFHPPVPDATPRGRASLLILARIQPLKGIELAIEALALVPAPRRPRLVIAGGTSPGHADYADGLHRLAVERGVGEDVDFRAAVPRAEAARLLREASLLLAPSHSETFGLVALEAAASGTPVIAARSAGGLAEAVADRVSGVLLDGRSASAWASAIDALLQDPARLAVLSASAAEHAQAHSWMQTVRLLERLYERVL